MASIELKISGGDLVVTLYSDDDDGRQWLESESKITLASLAAAMFANSDKRTASEILDSISDHHRIEEAELALNKSGKS